MYTCSAVNPHLMEYIDMIKLQALALILATVVAEVRKTYPMIPSRFIKMKGLKAIKIGYYGNERIIKCESENGINDRINALNELLALSDAFKRQAYEVESVTLIFGASRGNLIDTYYL